LKTNQDIYDRACSLIHEGHNEEACRLVFGSLGDDIVNQLTYLYRWGRDEATSIFHDAYLLIEGKIADNEIKTFNKTYFLSTCKFIGANQYRKCIRHKERMNGFVKEEMKQFNESVNGYCDIQIFNDEEELPVDWQKALRSFSLLNKNCQKYIRLKFVEQKSHVDIIKIVTNISTIRASITTLNRCIKRWKELLEKRMNIEE
jgi:hypothetical protein